MKNVIIYVNGHSWKEPGITLRWFLHICSNTSSRTMRRMLRMPTVAALCDKPDFCPPKLPLETKEKTLSQILRYVVAVFCV